MEDSQDNLMKQWMQTEMIMHRFHDINFRREGPKGAPHRGQGRILCIIKDNPGITQKDLCKKISMRQQSISELLKKLEKNNYISRCPSDKDKRTFRFFLTEEGKKLALPPAEVIKTMYQFFSCLSAEEQKNMADYLVRIRHNVEQTIEEKTLETNEMKKD